MGNGSIKKEDSSICSINDFIFYQPLGRGGFSTVNCVKRKKNNYYYALKIIPIVPLLTPSKHQLQNGGNNNHHLTFLKNEIYSLKLIGLHPFIIGLRYAFHNYINCYLVLDLVLGGNMRNKLKEIFPMDETLLSLVAYCIGSAIQFIHDRNILHRDIKPENILLDQHNRPYLTDFGISFIGNPTHSNELLVCSLNSGTIEYISPEIYTLTRYHGTASDYWSLGITLYELSYGITPFSSLPSHYINYAEKRKYYETTVRSSLNLSDFDLDYNSNKLDIQQLINQNEIYRSILFQDFLCQLLDIRIFYRIGGVHSYHSLNSHLWIQKHKHFIHQRISKISQQCVEFNCDDTFKISQMSSMIHNNSNNNNNNNRIPSLTPTLQLQTISLPSSEQYLKTTFNNSYSSSFSSFLSKYHLKFPDISQLFNHSNDVRMTEYYNEEIEQILQEYYYNYLLYSSLQVQSNSIRDYSVSVVLQSNDVEQYGE